MQGIAGMDITITLPGGKRVDAQVGERTVRTDQPRHAGGLDTAPAPFDLFLASVGTCAGLYVLAFCQSRGLPTDGVRLTQTVHEGDHGAIAAIDLRIEVPPEFPKQYLPALERAAGTCKVKRTIEAQPSFTIAAVRAERAA
jgi:putative redox protein